MTRRTGTGRKRKPSEATRRRARSGWLARSWRSVRMTLNRAPRSVRCSVAAAALSALALGVNWTYQVVRKPSELLFPLSGSFYKDPAKTWRVYGYWFEKHSTPVMTPDLLAALAQVEGSGNPIVRTYWRFTLTSAPFEIFRPASSAVGMYQITDGTFAIARRYCVHRHAVVEQGPWYDLKSCWFNDLYTRTVPSHAIEMTAAYLDRGVAHALARQPKLRPTLEQKQTLAAIMHLCGAGAAEKYARRGFAFAPDQRCGAHDARTYVGRVTRMQREFRAFAET